MRAQQVATESAAAQERGPPMQRWGGRLGGTPRPTTRGSRCCATTAEPRAAVERRPYRMMIIVRTALGLERMSLPPSTVSEMRFGSA